MRKILWLNIYTRLKLLTCTHVFIVKQSAHFYLYFIVGRNCSTYTIEQKEVQLAKIESINLQKNHVSLYHWQFRGFTIFTKCCMRY